MKKPLMTFLYAAFATLFFTSAARAEKSETFTLFTPRYYIDNLQYYGDPGFISGQRGSFTSFESFSAQSTYVVNSDLPAGYYVAKWVLYKAFTSTKIAEHQGGTSYTVTFDYKWAAKYGKQIDLVVYLEPITYTLSYSANGGSWTADEPEGGEYKGTASVTLPGDECVERANYTLTGWATKGSRTVFAPGESVTGTDLGVSKKGQAVTLYAQWGEMTYTVLLAVPHDAKVKGLALAKTDETWDYFKTTYVAGEGLTLPLATKSGSTFVAWYDNPNFVEDAESKIYSKVTKIGKDETGDKEYYAKFETKLAIHYDGNGASKGTMPDQSFVSGETISLDKCQFEKAYTVKFNANGGTGTYRDETAEYTFDRWNTEKDGTGDSYEDGQSVTFDKDAAFSLYAQWEPASVAITLPAAPTPKDSAKSFSGWYTAQTGGIRVGGAGSQYVPDGSKTLYARWGGQGALADAVGLTNAELTSQGEISWKAIAGGGSGGEDDPCIKLDDEGKKTTTYLNMEVIGPGKVTFSYKGQEGASKDKITVMAEKTKKVFSVPDDGAWGKSESIDVPDGSVVVQWVVTSPTDGYLYLDDITWTPTGGEGKFTITAEPSTYAGGTVTGGGEYKSGNTATLRAKPKTGWKFIGWKKDGATAIESTDNPLEVKVTADATYTAVLADEWYYISYNKNGGTGTMDKQLAVRDEDTELSANAFTRANYTFAGWNTAKDGTGKEYADKAIVRTLALSGSTITLYAQWKSGSEPEPTPEPCVYESSVGEAVSVDLAADYPDQTIKSVSGLPTGLKYNKTTGLVTGTPTKAVNKTDNVKITFTDKTTTKATWIVTALPTMLTGTYYGVAEVGDGTAGQFQLKLASTGKATGYFYAAGKKVSLKSTSLAAAGGGYVVTVAYTYDKAKHTDELLLQQTATLGDVALWTASIAGESEVLNVVDATRDVIKESGVKVKAATYDVEDDSLEAGDALKAKVTAKGVVKVSGKAADEDDKPVTVSCSTQLVFDEEGALYCWITIYKTVRGKEPIERCFQWYLPE